MKEQDSNVIGVGFGSDSVRAIVVKVRTGEVLATGISFYPRWKLGKSSRFSNVYSVGRDTPNSRAASAADTAKGSSLSIIPPPLTTPR